jgi:hypothetical protein
MMLVERFCQRKRWGQGGNVSASASSSNNDTKKDLCDGFVRRDLNRPMPETRKIVDQSECGAQTPKPILHSCRVSKMLKSVTYKTTQICTATFLHVEIVVPTNLLHQRTCSVSIVSVSIFLPSFRSRTDSFDFVGGSFVQQSIHPSPPASAHNHSIGRVLLHGFLHGRLGSVLGGSLRRHRR